MRGKQWPESKRIEALESFALSGSLALSSRETAVPKTTIKRWVDKYADQLEAIKQRNEEIRKKASEETIEEMTKRHAELARKMQEKALEGLGKLHRFTAAGVATLAKAGIDVERLARGEPSEIAELRGRAIDEAIERELEKLARASEERVSATTGEGAEGD